uniref:Uncharacterized protein n=1 Tax=Opuntia streptacantha TaxID=393608 RepID=A0A7C8Z9D8_OPUST
MLAFVWRKEVLDLLPLVPKHKGPHLDVQGGVVVGEVDIPIAEDVEPAHVSHTLHADIVHHGIERGLSRHTSAGTVGAARIMAKGMIRMRDHSSNHKFTLFA